MLIKRGDVKIATVIKDDEHQLDDEGTRKALDKATKELKKADSTQTTVVKPEESLEN